MKFKLNIPVRLKNPWFWIGLIGVILTAMGVDPSTFTSWEAVGSSLLSLVSNPFMIFNVLISVLGIFIDPTTSGIGDSEQALTYKSPKK